MAATVMQLAPVNDTKKIGEGIKRFSKEVGDVEKSLAKLKQLQAAICRKPDQCAQVFKDFCAEINNCATSVGGAADAAKSMQNRFS